MQLFVPERRLNWREVWRFCLEGRRRGQKGSLFVSEGRLHWREGAHITPSMQKQTTAEIIWRMEMKISALVPSAQGRQFPLGGGAASPAAPPLGPPLWVLHGKNGPKS